jgi:hypothetical protein
VKVSTVKFGIVLLLAASLAGCSSKSSVTGPSGGSSGTLSQRAAVSATLATAPDLIEDGIAESADQTTFNSSFGTYLSGVSGTSLVRPAGFWRRINHVDRSFEFAFSDTDSTGAPTRALVTIRKTLTGTFNLLAVTPPPVDTGTVALGAGFPPMFADTSIHIVHKSLEDHWVRQVLLRRISRHEIEREGEDDDNGGDLVATPTSHDGDGDDHDGDNDRPRWRIAAVSGVKVTSNPNTTHIVSVRIQTSVKDTTITDPMGLVRLRRFCHFTSGDSVRVTVTTTRNDDVVVLNYFGAHRRFTNHGDNTYSATFRSFWLAGVNHLGVNALSHGTLFDNAAPYDSDAWILPYVVAPTMLADYRP